MRVEFAGLAVPFLAIGGAVALDCDVRPGLGVVGVDLQPLVEARLSVRLDRLGRAFRLADAAVDALIRVDDEHVLALIETVHRTDFDAVHIFALDAVFDDDIGHACLRAGGRVRRLDRGWAKS